MKRKRFTSLFEFTYTLYKLKLITDENELENFFEALLHYWRQHDRATGNTGVEQIGRISDDLF